MAYRLKSSIVEAMRYAGTEESAVDCCKFIDQDVNLHAQGITPKVPALAIITARGPEACIAGDWLVKTAAGIVLLSDAQFRSQYEEIS